MTGAGLGSISFLDALRGQVDHILDACTRCGKCVEACPMVEPAGLDPADGVAITDGVLDLLAGGGGTKAAERWAQVCTTAGSASPPVITASIPALWSTWRGSRRRPNWAPTRSAAPPTNTSMRWAAARERSPGSSWRPRCWRV